MSSDSPANLATARQCRSPITFFCVTEYRRFSKTDAPKRRGVLETTATFLCWGTNTRPRVFSTCPAINRRIVRRPQPYQYLGAAVYVHAQQTIVSWKELLEPADAPLVLHHDRQHLVRDALEKLPRLVRARLLLHDLQLVALVRPIGVGAPRAARH